MRAMRIAGMLAAVFLLPASFIGVPSARAAGAVPSSSRWKPGVNFTVLSPAQPTNAPKGKVQVREFFYLACPYCHALEPYMLAWRKSKPAYVQFVRTPVMWHQRPWIDDARFYYTLEALGRNDLVETAFNTLHRLEEAASGDEDVMTGATSAKTLALEQAFAERHGVTAGAFVRAYDSFDVHVELQRARQLGQTYEVTDTPTIIVDGRFKTGPAKAGGDQQTIELINFLTRWIHEHPHAG